jgi:hypothetical protein
MREVNEALAVEAAKTASRSDNDDDTPESGPTSTSGRKKKTTNKDDPNQGVLLLDATCAPTNLNLLNEAREKLEGIVDTLHQPLIGQTPKPRT